MINEVKSCIKKYMPQMPYFDSIMAADCIKIDSSPSLQFKDFDVENFQLQNPVVLIEDEYSVQCYIDHIPYQKGVDQLRYFWEAIYNDDEETFKIILGKILKVYFKKDYSQYVGAVTIDCCIVAGKGCEPEVVEGLKIYKKLPGEVIEGVSKNAVNSLKYLMKHYKNKQAVH